MKQTSLIVAVLALSFAGVALAESPKVTVRADSGKAKVSGRTVEKAMNSAAEAGDVVVAKGGVVHVTYPNGCTVKVTGTYTVEPTPPVNCTKLAKVESNPGSHAAVGSGTATTVGAGAGIAVVGAGVAIAAGALAQASGGSDRGKVPESRASSP
ncbi:MAG TPA: hypothetical protein VIT90_18045 [Lysobacter sp.]